MATVSVRVSDELKERMEAHEEINWSGVLRQALESKMNDLDRRNVANAVATSERLSQAIDETVVAQQNTAKVIRRFRDRRYSTESTR